MKRRKSDSPFRDYPNSSEDENDTGAYFCFDATSQAAPCLQRELNQLPAKSRENAGLDVHGVPAERDDIPMETLEDLQECISEMDSSKKVSYEIALEMSPEYVMDPKFRIAFLRCVDGNVKKAAKRITTHFDTKLDLFGKEKLVKPIELEDLDEDDMEALSSGGFQVLPNKDRAGRPILFGRYTCMKYKHPKNMLRALWYCWSSMIEDPAHQISGVVALGFENGKSPMERFDIVGNGSMFDMQTADAGFDKELTRGILRIPLSVPIRPMGYHICSDHSPQWQGFFDMVTVTVCKFARIRIRLHFGSDQEVKYALMTQGVPVESIPVNSEGDVMLDNHLKWIEQRRQLEISRKAHAMDES